MNLDIFQRLLFRKHAENQDIEPDEILMNRLYLFHPDELPKINGIFNENINSQIKKSEQNSTCLEIDTTPTCYSCHFLIELITDCCNNFYHVKNID